MTFGDSAASLAFFSGNSTLFHDQQKLLWYECTFAFRSSKQEFRAIFSNQNFPHLILSVIPDWSYRKQQALNLFLSMKTIPILLVFGIWRRRKAVTTCAQTTVAQDINGGLGSLAASWAILPVFGDYWGSKEIPMLLSRDCCNIRPTRRSDVLESTQKFSSMPLDGSWGLALRLLHTRSNSSFSVIVPHKRTWYHHMSHLVSNE